MTPDEIIRLMAAASEYDYRVLVYPDGRVEVGPRNPTNAERQAAYRARKQAATQAAPSPPPQPPSVKESLTTAPAPKPRRSYGPEAGAEAIAPHANCGPRVAAAWAEWQQYRQARASHQSASLRIPWTVQAARMSASQVERAASTYGPELVADRIATAIAGNWQGLNFDKIQHHDNHRRSHHPSRNGSQSRPPDSATAAALDADFFPPDPG